MRNNLGRYLLILAAALLLWDRAIIKPLKIFTVFLHELGHALMAVIFGYGIKGFSVSLNEGGYTLVESKGWLCNFMLANGGYLGSLFFALLILYLKNTRFRKFIMGTLAIVFLGVSARYSGFSFALIYSIIFTGLVLILYMLQNEKVYDWCVDIIGVSSIAYAIYDTFVDTVLLQLNLQLNVIQGWKVRQPMTDAVQLAGMTGIPAMVWGIIWLGISVFAVYMALAKFSGSGRSRKRY